MFLDFSEDNANAGPLLALPLEMIVEIEGNVDIDETGSLALGDDLRAGLSHARDRVEFRREASGVANSLSQTHPRWSQQWQCFRMRLIDLFAGCRLCCRCCCCCCY